MGNRKSQKQIEAHPEKGVRYAHAESVDDDPLPSEQKILALHGIDPSILAWVKEKVDKEQDFRHEIIRRRTKIAEDAQETTGRVAKKDGFVKVFSLVIGGLLLVGCCLGAYLLIAAGRDIGWVLVGPPVMMVLAAIVSGKKTDSKK
jgi:uncharacterized membrane protein